MRRQLSMEQRLVEYADWRRSPGLHVATGPSIFHRIRTEQENAGAHGDGIKPDILVVDGQSVSCRPDGGMARMMELMGEEIARDSRCREMHELVIGYLPVHHRQVLDATYDGPENRSVRAAAGILKVSVTQYRERKATLVAWFEGAMFRSTPPLPASIDRCAHAE